MIIRQLVLHNFGIYRGRHVIDLSPPSRQKPVVLFGGLNGGGKTTLLDALQLALYGKFAECSNRGDLSYDEFLRRAINRSAPPHEGAALEIEFEHSSEGQRHVFRVHRSWTAREKGVRERLEVARDGHADPLLTESWSEHMEELIPVRLAKFFFFDGEKIESLADLDRSTEVLSTAIHSLLGLDLVDQLSTDLVVLERRKRAEQSSEVEKAQIEAAQRDVDRLDRQRSDLNTRRAAAQTALDVAQKRFRMADEKFRLAGGESYERRRETEAKREVTAERLRALEEELQELASSVAPLLLVQDLLADVATKAASDAESTAANVFAEVLAKRDKRAVAAAEKAGAGGDVLRALREFFAKDRDSRRSGHKMALGFELSPDAHAEIDATLHLLDSDLTSRLAKTLKQYDDVLLELQKLDRKLASAPDKDAIAAAAMARADGQTRVTAAEHELRASSEELERVSREYDVRWTALAKLLERSVEEQHRQEELTRILTHSERIRGVLGRFRSAVVERHVRRIEHLVLEGFQHLMRKQTLVSKLQIDPKSFALSLIGEGGAVLPPERLSAGERQLLAVSIIWGIARASGRILPVAVDTPLGRLDSFHRNNLVERYFPYASHQVLLFSTDKEIDAAELEKLRPSVGRTFHLNYDDRRSSTSIDSGYFW